MNWPEALFGSVLAVVIMAPLIVMIWKDDE